MIATRHRKALAELAAGGWLYVYCEAGPLCRRPPKVGSGVIMGGSGDRMAVSVGTVNAMARWTQWSDAAKASVIRPELKDTARMLGAGRDVIAL